MYPLDPGVRFQRIQVIAKAMTDIEIRSGATVTAGGLVFTALQDGWVAAYNDDTLEELWRFNVGTALKGAPLTYSIGTKQYVVGSSQRPAPASREIR
jgi:alcohol dehydrogenase (cytochrome c)